MTKPEVRYKYDAFLSYGHAADRTLSGALQTALGRIAKPWYRRRALRVFRDDTNLSATPGLWDAIEAALQDSAHFILLASPAAAESQWVAREVAFWVEHRSVATLLIVLTEGGLGWDEAAGDLDWTVTDALPPSLSGQFATEPLWVDLRFAKTAKAPTLDDPPFRAAVATLAAPLRGIDRDEIEGEDLRIQRRNLRTAMGAAVVLVLMLVASVVGWREAILQRNDAIARQYASQSALALSQDRPAPAYHLAAASWRAARADYSQRALFDFAERSPVAVLPHPDVSRAAFMPGGGAIVTLSYGLSLTRPGNFAFAVWTSDGTRLWTRRIPTETVVLSPDGSRVLIGDRDDPLNPAEAPLSILTSDGLPPDPFLSVELVLFDIGGEPLGKLLTDGRLARLAFVDDGGQVALEGRDGGRWLWHPSDGVRPASSLEELVSPNRTWTSLPKPDEDATSMPTSPGCDHPMVELPEAMRPANIDSGRLQRLGERQSEEACLSADGTKLATVEANQVLVWDMRPDHLVHVEHAPLIQTAASAPDGERFATGSYDGSTVIWGVDGTELARLSHRSPVNAIAWSPDGARLASAHRNGQVVIWTDRGVAEGSLTHDREVYAARFDQAGDRLITSGADSTIRVWSADGSPVRTLPLPAPTYDIDLSPHEDVLAAASADGHARVLALSDGREHFATPRHRSVQQVTFDPNNGSRVLVVSADTVAHLYDWRRGELVGTYEHQGIIRSASFCADGDHVVTASSDGSGSLWTDDGDALAVFPHRRRFDGLLPVSGPDLDLHVRSAFVSRDHLRVITAASDSTLRVWGTDGTPLATRGVSGPVVFVTRPPTQPERFVAVLDGSRAVSWTPPTPDSLVSQFAHGVREPSDAEQRDFGSVADMGGGWPNRLLEWALERFGPRDE